MLLFPHVYLSRQYDMVFHSRPVATPGPPPRRSVPRERTRSGGTSPGVRSPSTSLGWHRRPTGEEVPGPRPETVGRQTPGCRVSSPGPTLQSGTRGPGDEAEEVARVSHALPPSRRRPTVLPCPGRPGPEPRCVRGAESRGQGSPTPLPTNEPILKRSFRRHPRGTGSKVYAVWVLQAFTSER